MMNSQVLGPASTANRAVTKARDMVRMTRGRGDNDGADRWLQIFVVIEKIRQEPSRSLSQ